MQIRQNKSKASFIRQHGKNAVNIIGVCKSSISSVVNFSSPVANLSSLIDEAIELDNIRDDENNFKYETKKW